MAKTVTDAYSEILRLRNEFYQKWKEADQYDENRSAYKAKYEAFDKALELLTPCIVEDRPEPISPADVGFEALGKAWDKEAKKDSGELTHSVTKISDQEETVSDDLRKFAEEWDESLYRSDAVIAGAKWHKQQMIKSAKLSGWVARDENGSLHLFEVEPSRIMHRWWDRDYHSTTLDKKDFPDLEWEDEPVYVKLPIIVED